MDDRILWVEFAVGIFVRFLDAGNAVDDFQRFDEFNIYTGRITNQTDDGVGIAFGEVEMKVHRFEPIGQLLNLCLVCILSEFNNHE